MRSADYYRPILAADRLEQLAARLHEQLQEDPEEADRTLADFIQSLENRHVLIGLHLLRDRSHQYPSVLAVLNRVLFF